MIYEGMKYEYKKLSQFYKGVELGDILIIDKIDSNGFDFTFRHKNVYGTRFYECNINRLNYHLLHGYLKFIKIIIDN